MGVIQTSPFAPEVIAPAPAIDGVELAIGRAGFYKTDRPDLVLFRLAASTKAAGIFTTNRVGSSPTDHSLAALAASRGTARGLLVNAGCANAFTGDAGDQACRISTAAAAAAMGVPAEAVLAASTGVIGVLLDSGKILAVVPEIARRLAPGQWTDAARAIMTTDTFPKIASARAAIDGKSVNIVGIAKGSGMIAPDLATMLAFIFTDANISASALGTMLRAGAEDSFNSVTVDGDCSTNDCALLFATGKAGHRAIARASDPRATGFRHALNAVMEELAVALVKDGEGARKFVTIRIAGAQSDRAAKKFARTIAESPLVKTAIAGEDANWGRIVMALGRTGYAISRHRIAIRFGDLWAARNGAISPDYDEAAMSAYMKRPELEIGIEVGDGPGQARMRTCDLTRAYVEINGDYRS